MTKTITNLALPLIIQEIETILDTYHYHPYRQAYAVPELRQRLIAHVMNAVPACYAMVEENSEGCALDPSLVPSSMRHQLRTSIIEGIRCIFEENADWVAHHIPVDQNAGHAPSSWFG